MWDRNFGNGKSLKCDICVQGREVPYQEKLETDWKKRGGRSEEKGEEERVDRGEWFSRRKIVSEEENKYRGGT